MKFKDLMNLDVCERSDKIPIEVLKEHGVDAPDEVLSQFYSDHGRNGEFQLQYGNIELNSIQWQKISIKGSEIINCEYHQGFGAWIESAAARFQHMEERGWGCIDVRRDIVSQWENNKTWLISPIFINSLLIQKSGRFHLVEGHTRLGILIGAIAHGVISPEAEHLIWYGGMEV